MSTVMRRWTFKDKDKLRVAVYYRTGTLVLRGQSIHFQGGLYQKIGHFDNEFAAFHKLCEMFGEDNLVKAEAPTNDSRDYHDCTVF